ncbi:helix-turn-helix domain-containing protein [Ligilactobacillus equi]|uniref:Xre family toxin-antitoxin system n=1 Tax=Ligilactobacillus equi DPC 6820 TaxID=1392007 RepID=V7HTK6_9LACO|nr:helix-turn-helix transcriptional regulator [Ligilactobacillus equi]ETA73247.1 xre family toxin-antitoxin system [Ligilactobacillus equi DPC 6820]
MNNFENKIQALRENKGWSKTYVANRIGIKMQTYANYEYGRRQPDFETLSKIANLYSVTTDYLLGRDGKEENSADTKDLAEIMDSIMTYNGKELNQHDKDVVEGLISAYLNNKA